MARNAVTTMETTLGEYRDSERSKWPMH